MNEELVTFETAKLAKEKGFNWDCRYLYKSAKGWQEGLGADYNWNNFDCYSAPTQTSLQRWLRENHNIIVWISFNPSFDIPYMSHVARPGRGSSFTTGYRDTYEKALEPALIEALKLIIYFNEYK